MVPRGGLPPSSEIKDLESGGTLNLPTGSLGFLRRLSHPDRTGQTRPADFASTLTIIVTPAARCPWRYEARLDGHDRLLCVSRTPFFTAARKLLAEGHDRGLVLVMRHVGSDTESLRATLGAAATLTVEETPYGPKVRRWKPISTLAVAPKIAPDNRAARRATSKTPYTATRKNSFAKRQQPCGRASASSGGVIK